MFFKRRNDPACCKQCGIVIRFDARGVVRRENITLCSGICATIYDMRVAQGKETDVQ